MECLRQAGFEATREGSGSSQFHGKTKRLHSLSDSRFARLRCASTQIQAAGPDWVAGVDAVVRQRLPRTRGARADRGLLHRKSVGVNAEVLRTGARALR